HVFDRAPRHTGGGSGFGHGGGDLDDQSRIEGLGDDVVGAEGKVLARIGGGHFVILLGFRQLGDGFHAGQLHFLVDDCGAGIERATENEGEAQNVVDLVGVV